MEELDSGLHLQGRVLMVDGMFDSISSVVHVLSEAVCGATFAFK